MLEAGNGTKFLSNFANPTLWTLLGSHKELGGASERLTPGVCMLDNQSAIFRLVSPTGQVYRLDRVLLGSIAQLLMLGKAACIGLDIRRLELESCPF